MLSLRLTRKLEGLSDEALAHFEAQADLLLAMPAHGRRIVEPRFQLVSRDAAVAASRAALAAAQAAALTSTTAQLHTEAQTFVTCSRHLIATLHALARKAHPAETIPPRLALVGRSARR